MAYPYVIIYDGNFLSASVAFNTTCINTTPQRLTCYLMLFTVQQVANNAMLVTQIRTRVKSTKLTHELQSKSHEAL